VRVSRSEPGLYRYLHNTAIVFSRFSAVAVVAAAPPRLRLRLL